MSEGVQENPYVSVIIPIYNVEKYLDAAIESVCNQTYKNIQIILVDDGSTDKSGMICDQWLDKDERISVIHKDNEGVSEARNVGLRAAAGELIYFMDADDTVDAILVEKVVSQMRDDVDMVTFGYRLVYDDKEDKIISFKKRFYDLASNESKKRIILGDFFKYEIGWNVWNRFFRRKIIEKYDVQFDTESSLAEDQLFCLFYLIHCRSVLSMDKSFYNYYQRNESAMGKYRNENIQYFSQKSKMNKKLFEYYSRFGECEFFRKYEAVVHFLLIERVILEAIEHENYNLQVARKTILRDITRNSCELYWKTQLEIFIQENKLLYPEYTIMQRRKKIECARWLLKKTNAFFLFFCMQRRIQEK